MPFLAGLGTVVTGWLISNGKAIFKIVMFTSFVASLVLMGNNLLNAYNSIYTTITAGASDLTQTYGGLMGCIMSTLGLDTFMTSAFAIFFSAMVFWVTSVSYILVYSFGHTLYKAFMRALT